MFLIPLLAFSSMEDNVDVEKKVKWYTWEEAIAANKENPKKIMVDVYTTWCGPCKMMDRNTFENKKVADYINANFYPVKLDAEGKDDISYDGHVFTWQPGGRNGVHELSLALTDGNLRFPTIIFLDEKVDVISRMPGYMDAKEFGVVLTYHADNLYENTDWNQYFKEHTKN